MQYKIGDRVAVMVNSWTPWPATSETLLRITADVDCDDAYTIVLDQLYETPVSDMLVVQLVVEAGQGQHNVWRITEENDETDI